MTHPLPTDTSDTAAAPDRRALRAALGTFATGVTVVTACAPTGEWVGMTVNSFTSVSLDPPLVLWCIASDSPSFATFAKATHYAVNVLSDKQREVAQHFAERAPDKFAGMNARPGASGPPLLPDCAAYFECRVEAAFPGGDHLIMVGRVEHYARTQEIAPLIFHRGQYARLA